MDVLIFILDDEHLLVDVRIFTTSTFRLTIDKSPHVNYCFACTEIHLNKYNKLSEAFNMYEILIRFQICHTYSIHRF